MSRAVTAGAARTRVFPTRKAAWLEKYRPVGGGDARAIQAPRGPHVEAQRALSGSMGRGEWGDPPALGLHSPRTIEASRPSPESPPSDRPFTLDHPSLSLSLSMLDNTRSNEPQTLSARTNPGLTLLRAGFLGRSMARLNVPGSLAPRGAAARGRLVVGVE
ncbi:hypothetical protein N7462_008862 [Penicillium macrosclerotiorum]|uniref:uncharacterized protein n=1 Tax=Penicillium macrosclerotiorum TaxID=303699 RepID=UPI00254774A3|nr:uncharacterized protein N7462_008862 [Penicillium macrosclerotiorum]KAJ5675965.1 hypothetical protein N7462_008862 [Penicillium macrosclerotiorum]